MPSLPSYTSKPELLQQQLDEWMIRWRHFQTYEDYQIEKRAQSRRQRNYTLAGAVFGLSTIYTASPSTVKRCLSAPHFFDMGIDVTIKHGLRDFVNGYRRWTPNGYGRVLAIAVPTYLTACLLEHQSAKKRMNDYLAAETVFGEQARRYVKNGKIEEFLAINIGATLPATEAVIMPKTA
jgi:hypothetical protein